jgi:tetraacyldisaccharide 4'-kinase
MLWPLSALYGAAVALRRALYRSRVLATVKLPVPVVVVGNLFVGGTGKTPLTLALVEDLARAGLRPGIVCSGYGGRRRTPSAVTPASDPALVGDEPVLLARRSGCPVWTGRDRVAAARGLLGEHPGCNVVVCDDGLQHYRLARDFEIEVLDERGHGNCLLLPAGPLREPPTRTVDARVVNGGQLNGREDTFSMTLKPVCVYRLDRPSEPVDTVWLRQLRVHAAAGTGNPQRFFETLRALGFRPVTHVFPDHHAFTAEDLAFRDCDAVVMTEKDAVKCARLGRSDLYALRVDAAVEAGLFERVRARLGDIGG